MAEAPTDLRTGFGKEPHLKILATLGSGFCGCAYRVKDSLDGQKYAVKEIKITKKAQLQEVTKEVKALAQLEHDGVVKYFHPWVEDADNRSQSLCFKMELCGKNLSWWLEKYNTPEHRGKEQMLGIFYQMLSSLAYIHSEKGKNGFIHRDLKPDNIFLPQQSSSDNNGRTVKIGDFGLVIDADTPIKPKRKPSLYTAPEQSKTPKCYDKKVDVFALGIILVELMVPFQDPGSRDNALEKIAEGDFSLIEPHCPGETMDLVRWLCKCDPKERPSASKVLQSDHCRNFVHQVNDQSDPFAKKALNFIEQYWTKEYHDLSADKLTLLPAELKKEFYDGILIYHEDDKKSATDYRNKIQSLTMDNGSHPKVALQTEVADGGKGEITNIEDCITLSSTLFLLMTPNLCDPSATAEQFAVEVYLSESCMYPNEDKEHFVVPIFTDGKHKYYIRPAVKALTGIDCKREFDKDKFVQTLSKRSHERLQKEELQKFEQDKFLLVKRMGTSSTEMETLSVQMDTMSVQSNQDCLH